jgi:hypothetical protein
MVDQFVDRRTVGIPDPMIFLCEETKSYHDQAKKLIDDEKANEDARKAAEAKRAAAEKARSKAESDREGRFYSMYGKMAAIEDLVKIRLEELAAEYNADMEQCKRAIHVLGTLHPEVPYLALGNCLHFGTGKLTITNGMPVYNGATIVNGKLVLDAPILG